MTRALARSVVKAAAARLVGFIVARPALDAFLRRQVYRFPGLAGRVRMAVSRARRVQPPAQTLVTDEADLTDAGRRVLRDLARACDHPRQS